MLLKSCDWKQPPSVVDLDFYLKNTTSDVIFKYCCTFLSFLRHISSLFSSVIFIPFYDGSFKRQKHVIRCKELLTLFHHFCICIITVKPHWKAWGLVNAKVALSFISKKEKINILNLTAQNIWLGILSFCLSIISVITTIRRGMKAGNLILGGSILNFDFH